MIMAWARLDAEEFNGQGFQILDAAAITEGWFLERYGTASSLTGTALPQAQAYSSSAGTTNPIGVAAWTLEAVEDTPSGNQSWQKSREMNPATKGRLYGKNLGSSDISIGSHVAANVSGFQLATSGKFRIGKSEDDIAVGASGFITFDTNNSVEIAS